MTDYDKRRNPMIAWCVIVAAGLTGFSGIAGCSPADKPAERAEQSIPVRTEAIALRDIKETIDYVGDIRALDEVLVYPKVSGKIIAKLKEDGAVVAKGEAIAMIDRDEAGEHYEQAPVESPLAGTVGRVQVDIGTLVTPQSAVALIVNMSSVKIHLNIPEKYLADIRLGQTADISVDAYPNDVFAGEITKVSPVVDPALRAAPVEITVPNPDAKLRSGMFARVRIVMREFQGVPVIRKEALLGTAPDYYVYVIDGTHVRKRTVKTGLRQGGSIVVHAGLRPGDKVVVLGQQQLYDGAAVLDQKEGHSP
jgi:multidrug efflux pump subunit AcrA (membrane-fusion protein)